MEDGNEFFFCIIFYIENTTGFFFCLNVNSAIYNLYERFNILYMKESRLIFICLFFYTLSFYYDFYGDLMFIWISHVSSFICLSLYEGMNGLIYWSAMLSEYFNKLILFLNTVIIFWWSSEQRSCKKTGTQWALRSTAQFLRHITMLNHPSVSTTSDQHMTSSTRTHCYSPTHFP